MRDTRDRKDEYIDYLHDRIQFLEHELQKSEQTVLELSQEQRPSSIGDVEQAFEELLHAAKQLEQTEQDLDTLQEINERIEENNEEWFGEDQPRSPHRFSHGETPIRQ